MVVFFFGFCVVPLLLALFFGRRLFKIGHKLFFSAKEKKNKTPRAQNKKKF